MPVLEEIMYQTVDGVFAIDSRQRIIFWNRGCEELFGRSSQWVLGRPCCDVVCGKNPASGLDFCQPDCCVAKISRGGDAPNRFAIESKGGDGKPLTLSVNIMLVPSPFGKKWIVTHLLSRCMNQDILTTMNSASRPRHQTSSSSAAASIGQCERPGPCLTARESEVMQLLAEGLSSSLISKRLTVSRTTIRNHIQHIQNKLGVHRQAEAVAYAYRHNLVH